MLCDIVAEVLAREPDLEVVGTLSSRGDLRASVEETGTEVIVLGLEDSELPEDCGALFEVQPRIRMLGVAGDGRRGFLYELRPLKASLGELSPQGLVDAIRASNRESAGRLYPH